MVPSGGGRGAGGSRCHLAQLVTAQHATRRRRRLRSEDDRRDPVLRGRGRVRMLVTKTQVGAIMGRKGSTIK